MKSRISAVFALAMVAALALCLVGCGANSSSEQQSNQSVAKEETQQPEIEKHKLGETVSTDLIEFTLNDSQLAIALVKSMTIGTGFTYDNDFYLPKEYDPSEDTVSSFVAAKGHTLVSYVFTIKNLDRASQSLDVSHDLLSVSINGAEYSNRDIETHYGYYVKQDGEWSMTETVGMLIGAGETKDYRAKADIPVEVDDLSSPYDITFYLPNVDGSTTPFTYAINQ